MKFSEREVFLMEFLGYKTDMQKLVCYEGWEGVMWEQKANGIPYHNSFRQYLEDLATWSINTKLQKTVDKYTR